MTISFSYLWKQVGNASANSDLMFNKEMFNEVQSTNNKKPLTEINSECPEGETCSCIVFGGTASPLVEVSTVRPQTKTT